MKLEFPNGEHASVELGERTSIGSSDDADVTLATANVAPIQVEIIRASNGVHLKVVDRDSITRVNGHTVKDESLVSEDDLINVSAVSMRLRRPENDTASTPAETEGATKVRMALPKFMLRGVSGAEFGKTFALHGSMTVGRHSDCDIAISSDEISRHHARLTLTPAGLQVEDLGSANGTYINGKKVNKGTLQAGDELKLDQVRFMVQGPNSDRLSKPAAATPTQPNPELVTHDEGGGKTGLIVGTLVVLAAAGAGAAYFMGLLPI